MAKLRIEFSACGGARGRLGGQVDAREAEPLGSITLDVGAGATAPGGRPTVPLGRGTVFVELIAADVAIYVDIGPTPDPGAEPRLLVLPGKRLRVHAHPGHLISAVRASEIPRLVQSVQDQPFAPIRGTTITLSVASSSTGSAIALPACSASSYRARNAAASTSPIAWTLNAGVATHPVMPAPYDETGSGGSAGDIALDPGSVEVFGLDSEQQAALAAGALYLSAICPPGGSATLSITPGLGA